jgi:adenylosuccinate lyase
MDAARAVKEEGRANDLLERLKSDPAFANVNLGSVLDPRRYVGRAPQQVVAFVEKVVGPIRARYNDVLGQAVELKV